MTNLSPGAKPGQIDIYYRFADPKCPLRETAFRIMSDYQITYEKYVAMPVADCILFKNCDLSNSRRELKDLPSYMDAIVR